MHSHHRYTAHTVLVSLCFAVTVTASGLPSPSLYFPFPPSFWTVNEWTKAFSLAVWTMVWHSSRISLTALLQTSALLQRDGASLKCQRKATKLNKKSRLESSVCNGESWGRIWLSFRASYQLWQSRCKPINKSCCFHTHEGQPDQPDCLL